MRSHSKLKSEAEDWERKHDKSKEEERRGGSWNAALHSPSALTCILATSSVRKPTSILHVTRGRPWEDSMPASAAHCSSDSRAEDRTASSKYDDLPNGCEASCAPFAWGICSMTYGTML